MFSELVGNYEGSESGAAWADSQSTLISAQKAIFLEAARPLSNAFADCMQLIGTEIAFPPDSRFVGRVFHARVMKKHTHQLLAGAWAELEAGRIAASVDHVRSIFEAPDYLLAVLVDKDFGDTWQLTDLFEDAKARRAMEIVRDELDQRTSTTRGTERYNDRVSARSAIHHFSHLSVSSAAMTLYEDEDQESQTRFRIKLGYGILTLAHDFLFALSLSGSMRSDWDSRKVHDRVTTYLKTIEPATGGIKNAPRLRTGALLHDSQS